MRISPDASGKSRLPSLGFHDIFELNLLTHSVETICLCICFPSKTVSSTNRDSVLLFFFLKWDVVFFSFKLNFIYVFTSFSCNGSLLVRVGFL